MIRFIIVVIAVVLFFTASLIIIPIEYLIGLFSKKARERSSYAIVQWALRVVIFMSGIKLNLIGFDKVPKDRPVLYVGNHRSFFDIIISYSMVPRTGYIAKKEIKKVPILSWWMVLVNCLFLDRKNPREGLKTILQAIENINNGISVFIFPEGTRAKSDDEMRDFKEGSLKIAQKTNCPVIPVSFNNTSAIFEDQFPKIRPVKVTVEFGTPIIPSELPAEDNKHLGKYTHDIVKGMLERNKVE